MISLIIGILLIKISIIYSLERYTLNNGVTRSLFNIKENSSLYFSIGTTSYQKIIAYITLDNDDSSINTIQACSYNNLNSTCFYILNQMSFKRTGMLLVGTYEYSFSNNYTNYVVLHFTNNKNINYFTITIYTGNNTYNLTPGLSKNIKNLLTEFMYFFKVPVKENQRKINITFIITNTTIRPFDFFDVIEYHSEKGRTFDITKQKYIIRNESPKNNQLEFSFYHLIWVGYDDINYIDVVVRPKKKIANLNIKIDVDYCYDLNYRIFEDEKYSTQLKNLKSNFNYYLHFKLMYLEYANITLSMNKMSSQPFNSVSISYYENENNAFPKDYSNQIVSFGEVNNKFVSNLTIHNNYSSEYINYITLNFTPTYDIDYIDILLEIGGTPTDQYYIIDLNDSHSELD